MDVNIQRAFENAKLDLCKMMISPYYLVPVGRHCEERSDEAIQENLYGLPRRFAPRNDGPQELSIAAVFEDIMGSRLQLINGEGQ